MRLHDIRPAEPLFWVVGTGRCTQPHRCTDYASVSAHHSCAERALANRDVVYCECRICMNAQPYPHQDHRHYYAVNENQRAWTCPACVRGDHPQPPVRA